MKDETDTTNLEDIARPEAVEAGALLEAHELKLHWADGDSDEAWRPSREFRWVETGMVS